MTLGMTVGTFTLVHVLISLVALGAGFVVIYGLLTGERLEKWTALYLATMVLTDVTGFLFPFHRLLPSYIIGALSLAVLVAAIVARYGLNLRGAGRWVYAICAVVALYLDTFVTVVQAFLKIPTLKLFAPTQKEPPFLVTQLVVLVAFVVLGVFAVKKFHIQTV